MSGTVNYYDYSEQYEAQEVMEPQASSVPTGFVRHIKTIIEERGTPEPGSKANNIPLVDRATQQADEMVPSVAELPASPVPRRITRDLVLAGIGPGSSSGEVETCGATAEARNSEHLTGASRDGQAVTHTDLERRAIQPNYTMDVARNRHSILSQAGSSVMDSSTLEFAVRCSIPMVADQGVTLDIDEDTTPVYSPDPDPTSEDGMTDLLEGYQRTDTRRESEDRTEAPDDVDEPLEKKSNHAAKSSDEQSFKSCTDVIKVPENPVKESDAKSFKSCKTLPEPYPPFKDSDARSFRTCKDAVTPNRIASLPPSRLPSSQLVTSESTPKRPYSAMPLSSPLATDHRVPPSSTSDSSMSRVVGRFRANSKPSSTQGSAAGSLSSIKEHGVYMPPAVPPRESSSSKEAQQSRGVANFLLRSVRQRFTKASPGSNLRSGKENMVTNSEDLENLDVDADIPTPPPMKDRTLTGNISASVDRPLETPRAPQQVLTKQQVVPHRQGETMTIRGSSVVPKDGTPDGATTAANSSNVRHISLDPPSPLIPDASSVYSPEKISLTGSRSQKSPATLPQTPEHRRRDSQTTTHLSWTGGNAFHPLPISADRVRDAQGNNHDDSTTDLRMPGHRHAINHLPDLKEESHEDSSLNTSASNFRPFGGSQPAVFRLSTDEVAMSRRHPSMRSSRNSVLLQMHLPSMNFSSFGSFEEALDHRVSRSLDLAPAARAELAQAVMPRSASAGEDRDKYRSVFAGLDTPAKTSKTRQQAAVDAWMRKSPDTFVKEVDSLTIPSVNGLTTRLSEMLPKLKEALGMEQADEFPDEEGIMEKALEKLNEVGIPAQKRSSARLRPVPGSPNMLVVDDDVFKEITGKEKSNESTAWTLNQDYVALGGSAPAYIGSQVQGEVTGLVGSNSVAPVRTRGRSTIRAAELEAPSPAHLRHNTTSLSPTRDHFFPTPASRPSSRLTRSLETTPTATITDTRPWNCDKNYPWATDPSVDISLPPPSASKHSPRPGPSHLRNRLSNASSDTGTSSQYVTSASPPARRGPTGRCYNFLGDGRRSLDPSAVGFDASGYPTGPVRVRDDDQSHGAGERYPTSALPLPSNLHIYPGQASHFSLETSDEEPETTSPRKTLFGRRARRNTRASANRRDLSQANVRELQQSRATDHSTQEQDTLPDRSRRQTFSEAEGMSQLKYLAGKILLGVVHGTHATIEFFRAITCCPRSSSSASDSAEATITAPTPANSPASVASSDTEVPRPVEPDTPALRPNPGRRFTPGFFFSFPSLASDDGEHSSAFQSNIPPRNYGTIAPQATDRPASH
ncbi:hypothetical protein N0V90_010208 [Kalmusia sp. IMI 367209]|nr:hypothetical protein N0V90_010208 [Kalmusia sp. IMI 367209]